jgi:nucleoid-associated protein YgaU
MHTATATAAPSLRSTPRPGARPNPRPVARSVARRVERLDSPPFAAPMRERAATHPAAAGASSAVGFGRRRAAAVACAAVVALSAIGIGFGVGHAAAEGDCVAPAPVVYVVQPGDTLWAIAGKVAPKVNTARAVDALRSAAGGSSLTPGQRINLPDSLS